MGMHEQHGLPVHVFRLGGRRVRRGAAGRERGKGLASV